ncbi:M13 family metallopeptidase [Carboxylicivirga caseinilyticus]|uniref:M13 family metallopeptidase n=1 Tax=Carboxylicivirga caseinilyticus TaxID=3417572 RepID=UPI003D358708|nr:M13 family metallopeptidase [Marinilabiliaceae bacterium A049]
MNSSLFWGSLLTVTIGASSCASGSKEQNNAVKPVFSANDMDLTIDPGTNFFEYVNGGWRKQHPLPDDKSRFGSFDLLAEDNKEKVKLIIENAASEIAEEGSVSQKIGDFYASGMDLEAINKAGFEPIQPLLSKVNSIEKQADLVTVISFLQQQGINPLFHYSSTPDQKNSEMTIAGIYQGGLGMPDRDYYLEDTEDAKKLREAYNAYLTSLFTLVGNDENNASELAKTVFELEMQLAKASNSRLENRDPHKTYNKVDIAGVEETMKPFPFATFIKGMGYEVPAEINMSQPEFLKEVGKLYKKETLTTWKAFLTAVILRNTADYLSEDFVNAHFAFYGKAMSGKKEQELRWKKVVNNTNGALGEAVGQLFVAEYFPPAAKQRMDKLVENLRIAFGQRIDQLEWMSEETKKAAHEKLDAIRVKIGYPNKWRDYSDLKVVKSSYIENILASNRFELEYDMAKIGKPVDKEEWFMTPQTVNAYYNPLANEIVFPAAILQPPFFYLDGDDAVNYGAIGVVIGHEMTHGFDDQGRFFAKDGNMEEWWTAEDAEKFNARTKVLVDQFNSFEVLPGVFANGELSLGENIADLGGLLISYQAYLNSLNGKENNDKIDGFTDKQRFYLAYSRVWAQNIRDEEIARLTKVDVHSLGTNRVNGPLPNIQEWYDAFGLDAKSPLYIAPEDRTSIW